MMHLVIKNIILYDNYQQVMGFVELKNLGSITEIKIKHNLDDKDLILTVATSKDSHTFNVGDKHSFMSIKREINLDEQVAISLIQKNENEFITIATGIINEMRDIMMKADLSIEPPRVVGALKSILEETAVTPIERNPHRTMASREIDEVLRAVCTIDDKGKGICENCPYRDFFYEDKITHNA